MSEDMWLRACEGMLHAKYVCTNKSSFCASGHKFEVNPASISFGDITGFKTVVCLFIIIIGIIVITIIILVGLTCICT